MTEQKISTERHFTKVGHETVQTHVDFKNGPVGATYSQDELQILGDGDAQKGFQKVRRAMRQETGTEALPGMVRPLNTRIEKAKAKIEGSTE